MRGSQQLELTGVYPSTGKQQGADLRWSLTLNVANFVGSSGKGFLGIKEEHNSRCFTVPKK